MFKTALTEMLGIEYPIIQAGMGGVALAELTAAVSNAGGLGVLAGAMMEADEPPRPDPGDQAPNQQDLRR